MLHSLHDIPSSGHLGYQKTLAKVRARFYWHGLALDVEDWCAKCAACARKKGPPGAPKAPLVQRSAGFPMERIEIDMIGPLPKTATGNTCALVITDCFTKWKEAIPLPDQKAVTVAHAIETEFFCRFGTPATLHADQGRNFESKLFQEVCAMLNIEKTRASPNHAQSNGEVERFNQVLGSMLRCYVSETQKDWDTYLPQLLLAYRSSEHSSTKRTPFFMMFGYEVPLPVDVMFGRPTGEPYQGANEWAADLRRRKEEAYADVRNNLRVSQRRQKAHYDRRVKPYLFKVGDRVWMYNPSHKTGLATKLVNKWRGPYVIIKFITDVVVRLQNQQNRRDKKVRHINCLVHCTSRNAPDNPNAMQQPEPATGEHDRLQPRDRVPHEEDADSIASDDELPPVLLIQQPQPQVVAPLQAGTSEADNAPPVASSSESDSDQESEAEDKAEEHNEDSAPRTASSSDSNQDTEDEDQSDPETEQPSHPVRTTRMPARLRDYVTLCF